MPVIAATYFRRRRTQRQERTEGGLSRELLAELLAIRRGAIKNPLEPWGFEPQILPCHGSVIPFHYGPGNCAGKFSDCRRGFKGICGLSCRSRPATGYPIPRAGAESQPRSNHRPVRARLEIDRPPASPPQQGIGR